VRSVVRSKESPRRPPDRVDGVCGLLPRRHRPDDRRVVSRRADARAVRGHDRDSRAWRRPMQSGSGAGSMAGSGRDQGERDAGPGERGGRNEGKARFDNRRGARSVSPRVPPNTRAGCRRRADRGRTACRDPWPRPARDAPEGAALAVPRPPRKTRIGGAARVSSEPTAEDLVMIHHESSFHPLATARIGPSRRDAELRPRPQRAVRRSIGART
jgi:hypothetical protein